MPTTNDIVLRPRFKIELNENNETVLKRFEDLKASQTDFTITRIDNHVFIKYPKKDQHFWSPQLHLEIDEVDQSSSLLHGLYGPNPTVWTMFMFLHFVVASLFIAIGIWAYTNWSLKSDFMIQVSLMVLMVIIWFVLYFAGRIGRDSSKKEMIQLRDVMDNVLQQKKP
ncbi:GTP-binding protein [Hyunsoonleella flava]|uniref:GTP-binding protein n=1 Tax=Hyunsoonleella flava TaxID=2527939 RepID=A0A4Q9FDK6_9FLAO|nr:GTP-binding protein [Hyunsoonleella flava]TBN00885.1 GTP-binding protein [Hyunsoonleella flava]